MDINNFGWAGLTLKEIIYSRELLESIQNQLSHITSDQEFETDLRTSLIFLRRLEDGLNNIRDHTMSFEDFKTRFNRTLCTHMVVILQSILEDPRICRIRIEFDIQHPGE